MKSKTKKTVSKRVGPYQIGQAYFIRTVTMYYTGKLTAVFKNELVLETAAWIADTGRYFNALKSGDFNEIEPIALAARQGG